MRTIKLELKVTDETFKYIKTMASNWRVKTREEVLLRFPSLLAGTVAEHKYLQEEKERAKR